MITVSEEARALVRDLLASDASKASERGTDRGVRITALAQAGETAFEVQIAQMPHADDTVIETGDVRLFLDRQAAGALDDAELVVDGGELALALPEPATADG